MPTLDSQTIALVFIAIATLALILQTIFLIVLATAINKYARSALEEIENVRSSLMPVIYNTREIINRISPKIEDAADELTALTRSLRAQTADVQEAATEVIGRAQRIAARLDAMASTVLDSVERAAEFMSETVAKPMRQITGVVASVRAIVDALRTVDDSHSSQPQWHTAGNEPGDTRSSETRSSEPRSSEPRSSEPQSNEPRSSEKDMFV